MSNGIRRRRLPGLIGLTASTLLLNPHAWAAQASGRVQFLFTSDAHYGLRRASFRGRTNVDAEVVNAAMVAAMNELPPMSFPRDGGIGATSPIGAIDFLVNGGDIASRAEETDAGRVQPASTSWAQFEHDYIRGLTVTDAAGRRAAVWAVPGNHDVSNAIGFYRPLEPARDASALAGLFNLMMRPTEPLRPSTLTYPRDRVLTSREVDGIDLEFLTVWPDSAERAWMASDLSRVPPSTPVLIFTHDQPDAETKHFTNPNGEHDINDADRFENLLVDSLEDGSTIASTDVVEQRDLETFVRAHPNISAYFHGNSNWNQFYDWTGPDHTIALHTFRVDSPIKGAMSAMDETRLSFQIATIDLASQTMTVRECLWNTDPSHPDHIAWGGSTTVALVRETLGR